MFDSLRKFFSQKSVEEYKISFSIMDKMVGGGSYGYSYDPEKTNFSDVKMVFIRHLEKVCPPEEAILVEYEKMVDLDVLDKKIEIGAKYWVNYSIESKNHPGESYHLVHYSNVEKDYNVGVRQSIANALADLAV